VASCEHACRGRRGANRTQPSEYSSSHRRGGPLGSSDRPRTEEGRPAGLITSGSSREQETPGRVLVALSPTGALSDAPGAISTPTHPGIRQHDRRSNASDPRSDGGCYAPLRDGVLALPGDPRPPVSAVVEIVRVPPITALASTRLKSVRRPDRWWHRRQ
jgi:hypothetical protein